MLDYPKAKAEIEALADLIFEVGLKGDELAEAEIDLDELKASYREGNEDSFWWRAIFLRRRIQPE